jgi:hypothetical protein
LSQITSLNQLAGDKRVLTGAAVAGVILVGFLLYVFRSRPPSTDELERRRRLHVNHIGRIAEGRVTDLMKLDAPAPEKGGAFGVFRKTGKSSSPNSVRQMICYSYSISGVTYETAQDVTGLEERLKAHRIITGQPASVKYDPSNPSNSILVADDWSGLH